MGCDCGSENSYEICCGPYLDSAKRVENAEALMRSRFTAFKRARADYILETQTQSCSFGIDPLRFKAELVSQTWVKLEVLDAKADEVTFVAYLLEGETLYAFKERSAFVKEADRWLYAEALSQTQSSQSIGRNECCPCGSGKKLKRCTHQKEV